MWSLCEFVTALVILVVSVEAITEILVSSVLLDIIGLRPWISKIVLPDDGDFSNVRWYHHALHKLLTCGYCASVWVAFCAAWAMPGDYFGLLPWNNIIIKTFVIHRFANWLHMVYELIRRGRVHTTESVMRNLIEAPIILKVELSNVHETPRRDGPSGGTS